MEASKNTFGNTPQNQDTKLNFLNYWRITRIRKTVILAVFLLVVLTTTAVTFILPETYMSMSRIEVGKDTPDIGSILQPTAQQGYDPYFIQTEFEKIKSTKVLHRVIEELNLQNVWAKRWGTETLKIGEAYKVLLGQIDLRQSRNTSLIEIRAYSDMKQEAADIANKIAEVYRETRKNARQELSQGGINALEEEYQKHHREVQVLQSEVDKKRSELKISDVGDSFFQTTTEPETVRNIERDRVQDRAARDVRIWTECVTNPDCTAGVPATCDVADSQESGVRRLQEDGKDEDSWIADSPSAIILARPVDGCVSPGPAWLG